MEKAGSKYFLIDGFPRSQNNLDGWQREMSHKVKLVCVLVFDCPEEECVKRCLSRGEAGSGRSDDNPESLKKRIVTYGKDTEPIINYFIEKKLVHTIDAAENPDKVCIIIMVNDNVFLLLFFYCLGVSTRSKAF